MTANGDLTRDEALMMLNDHLRHEVCLALWLDERPAMSPVFVTQRRVLNHSITWDDD